MLLKLGPEDVPYSPRLLRQVIMLNAISGIMVLISRVEVNFAVMNMALDLALLLGFTYVLLRALNKLPRFVQTLTALCGVGIIYHLLTWPLLVQMGVEDSSDIVRAMASLLMLFLISWQVLVIAHIFRRAIDSGMTSAIALSFALFLISVTASQILFADFQ
jgi:hypothetical protein